MIHKFAIWLIMYQVERKLGANGSSRRTPPWMERYTLSIDDWLRRALFKTPWVEYDETFSLVAKIKSIRIMIDIVAFHDYEIW